MADLLLQDFPEEVCVCVLFFLFFFTCWWFYWLLKYHYYNCYYILLYFSQNYSFMSSASINLWLYLHHAPAGFLRGFRMWTPEHVPYISEFWHGWKRSPGDKK